MNKTYDRINWENYPSDATPLNEQNLNKMDSSVDELDNRVISLDTTKFDKTEAQGLFKDVSLDRKTGIITFTLYSGATKTIDTLLEKIAVNFDYDYLTQMLIITLDDGEVKYIDLSSLITQYEFLDSETIAFSLDSSGKVLAIVKEGSIEEKHLQPNYLADIKVESAKAQASATAAAKNETNAANSATESESYAHGGTGTREGEDTDNSMYYYQQSKSISESFAGALRPMGTTTFSNLPAVSDASEGDMYNISDEFTTTSSFKEGEGNTIPMGSNIYKTTDGYWDVLAGSPVTTVNGQRGNVEITPENIDAVSNTKVKLFVDDITDLETNFRGRTYGENADDNYRGKYIGAFRNNSSIEGIIEGYSSGIAFGVYDTHGWICPSYRVPDVIVAAGNENKLKWKKHLAFTDSDTANNTISFISDDSESPTEWTDVPVIETGEKHSSLLKKVSSMFKNIRWLNVLINTAHSSINSITARFNEHESTYATNSEYGHVKVDNALSSTSENPVQNKVVDGFRNNVANNLGKYQLLGFTNINLSSSGTMVNGGVATCATGFNKISGANTFIPVLRGTAYCISSQPNIKAEDDGSLTLSAVLINVSGATHTLTAYYSVMQFKTKGTI